MLRKIRWFCFSASVVCLMAACGQANRHPTELFGLMPSKTPACPDPVVEVNTDQSLADTVTDGFMIEFDRAMVDHLVKHGIPQEGAQAFVTREVMPRLKTRVHKYFAAKSQQDLMVWLMPQPTEASRVQAAAIKAEVSQLVKDTMAEIPPDQVNFQAAAPSAN